MQAASVTVGDPAQHKMGQLVISFTSTRYQASAGYVIRFAHMAEPGCGRVSTGALPIHLLYSPREAGSPKLIQL